MGVLADSAFVRQSVGRRLKLDGLQGCQICLTQPAAHAASPLCSEIQFRQVAGDFERFQGKWMLQGVSSTSSSSGGGSSSSGSGSSSSDGEVRTFAHLSAVAALARPSVHPRP